jgi:hypothetical protein
MFPCSARRGAIVLSIACALLVLPATAASAADFGSTAWIADVTVTDPPPGDGLFHDAIGDTYVYASGILARVTDDPQGDFFMISPRTNRATVLRIGSQSWNCGGGNNVWVNTPGVDWFPSGFGTTGLDGSVYCYEHDTGAQVRADYADCLSVTRLTDSAAGGARWHASSSNCPAVTVSRATSTTKGKTVWSFLTQTVVPFEVTACLRGTLKQWRTGDVLPPGCSGP